MWQALYRAVVFLVINIKPEKADNKEFRLGYQSMRWQLAVTRFDSDIENKIRRNSVAGGVIAGVGTPS
jgi:outer membrane receptor for ferrienterochelin and colicin